VQVGPGEEAYLVVHESASSGWQARLGGKALRAQRIDGWQQAWVLPAGAGGTVRLDFAPGRDYQRELLVGALLVLLLLALAVPPGRAVVRTERATDAWPVALVVSAAVLLLVGGVPGVVVLAVLLVARRHLPLPFLAGAAMGLCGLLTAYAPWAGPRSPGAFSRPVQLLALVVVAAVAAAVSGRRSPSGASAPEPGAPPGEGSAPPPAG
jgi:arabinofuranan 3-O-arabinosyltransferase